MELFPVVVRTRLTPPRPNRRILQRPRLAAVLAEALDFRVTVVQAGAGYGKSTALASLADLNVPLAWYQLDSDSGDPLVFLLHILHSLRAALPGLSEAPLARLESWNQAGAQGALPWPATVDLLANALDSLPGQPVLLVLDDAHFLNGHPQTLAMLDRLIDRAPDHVHFVLATRYPLEIGGLARWQARGQVLAVDQRHLAFQPSEIAALFAERYDLQLSHGEVQRIAAETEGWAIAVQLVWQGLRTRLPGSTEHRLSRTVHPTPTLDNLFAFLAQEVVNQQPADVQSFLRDTAVLREMSVETCNCLRNADGSAAQLRHLLDSGLFVVDLGGGHARYHHLFREFLMQQLADFEAATFHSRAAACFEQQGAREEALYHRFAAGQYDEAAALLDALGRTAIRAGRLDTLAGWIDRLPPEILESHPALLVYLGDIARLHSRFEEALGWYRQAEGLARLRGDAGRTGQALRGQARIYLDTVNPSQAESLLQEALRLSDGQEDREARIRLLELLEENRLNLGKLEDAARFRAQAQELREEGPSEVEMNARVLVRTGRLAEARRLLERWAETEQRDPVLRPRAHRETQLLLSLVLAFQGEGEAAYESAVQGKQRGRELESPFITAVGFMREGHAWLLRDHPNGQTEARRCYRETIALADSMAVPRLKVEAYWGLCRAYGYSGEIEAAEQAALQGIEIARHTGDEWIVALIRLALGAGLILSSKLDDGMALLARSASAFGECSDSYGETLARLWQCLAWQASSDEARLQHGLEDLLRLTREHGYEFLFTRQTLLGPPDARRVVPLLVSARNLGRQRPVAESLLARLDLARVELHPGYQLRVQTLGAFRAWRGSDEIVAAEWHREKARQLFLLFITQRRRRLERDEIVEKLWPDLSPDAAERDFKVALNTLYRVLEPNREARTPSAYIVRDGTHYGLRPGADLWLDADRFEQLLADGTRRLEVDEDGGLALLREALALYRGSYLAEYPYEEWCSVERERLLTLFLRAADRVAQALADRGRWQEVITVCQSILAADDCWENAYRLSIAAYAALGNRTQAMRVYGQCVERLQSELGVPPSPATVAVYESLRVAD
ncbi:MAG: BTAD domain-containing putative transcriptional regulator [Caldilineales bacterium]